MSENTSSTAPTGTAYVFVKLQGAKIKKQPAKRVLIPGSLQAFRKACQNMFKLEELIKAFYNSDEKFIRHVSELEPGTTVIASTDEPQGDDANFDFEQQQREKIVRQFDPSAPLQYAEFPKPKKVPLGKAPKCLVVGFPEPLTVDQANIRTKSRKILTSSDVQSSRTSRLSSAFSKRGASGMAGDGMISNQNFHFFDQASYTYVSSDASVSTTAIKPQKIELQKEALSKTRLDQAKILLSRLFTQQQLDQIKQVSNAFAKLSGKKRKFISKADASEILLKKNWLQSLFDFVTANHFCEKTTGLFLNEEIIDYIKDSVVKHRFIAGGVGGHRFNTAIVGPPKSGKSTLLEIYTQEIIVDLAICGDWKNCFLFPFDFKELVPKLSDFKEFYITMIHMICEAIIKEKPVLTKLIPDVRRYLESLITDPIPLILQKSFVENIPQKIIQQKVQNLGDEILSTWKNPIALESWINLMFELPILLPRAVGFAKTIFIIDNIDYCDIKIEPKAPFEDSKRMAFISEHLKYALSQSDYLFACHNMPKMYEILISVDQEGVDLFAITDFVSTNGISPDLVENDLPLIVSLTTQEIPFVMKGSDCDGVPNYIMLWKDLNQSIDELESIPEGSDEYDDSRYYSIAHCQAIMNLMFFSADADYTDAEEVGWPHVLAVRRASENENTQMKQEEIENQMHIQDEIEAIPIAEANVEDGEGIAATIEIDGTEPVNAPNDGVVDIPIANIEDLPDDVEAEPFEIME